VLKNIILVLANIVHMPFSPRLAVIMTVLSVDDQNIALHTHILFSTLSAKLLIFLIDYYM